MKETSTSTSRLSEEDIHRIVEGLEVARKDEHTPLAVGVQEAIDV